MVETGSRTDVERIRWLHEVLQDRGWSLSTDLAGRVDEVGYPLDEQPEWVYPASFGGAQFWYLHELSPDPLHCFYGLGARNEIVELNLTEPGVLASVAETCAEHQPTGHEFSPDPEPDELYAALERAEARARAMDVREFIDCLFFGPCGQARAQAQHRRR